jgi:serine/threonine protein kinase
MSVAEQKSLGGVAAAAVPTWPVGHRIGNLELQAVISRGRAGPLYRAWDHSLARQVAVKEYLPTSLSRRDASGGVHPFDPDSAKAFELGRHAFIDEARTLARCDHPALVRVLQLVEFHGTAYRVMPWYAGRLLLDVRRRLANPFGEAALRLLLDDLLGALDAYHRVAGAHGGVTPAHVLLLDDGHSLLMGPGAARRAIQLATGDASSRAAGEPNSAASKQPVGLDGKPQSQAGDLHSLAAVARFCITGMPPNTDTSVYEPLGNVVKRLFSDQPSVRYDATLLRCLDNALSRDSASRPQTAGQFRQLLPSLRRSQVEELDPEDDEDFVDSATSEAIQRAIESIPERPPVVSVSPTVAAGAAGPLHSAPVPNSPPPASTIASMPASTPAQTFAQPLAQAPAQTPAATSKAAPAPVLTPASLFKAEPPPVLTPARAPARAPAAAARPPERAEPIIGAAPFVLPARASASMPPFMATTQPLPLEPAFTFTSAPDPHLISPGRTEQTAWDVPGARPLVRKSRRHKSRAGLWAGLAFGAFAAVGLSVWLLQDTPFRMADVWDSVTAPFATTKHAESEPVPASTALAPSAMSDSLTANGAPVAAAPRANPTDATASITPAQPAVQPAPQAGVSQAGVSQAAVTPAPGTSIQARPTTPSPSLMPTQPTALAPQTATLPAPSSPAPVAAETPVPVTPPAATPAPSVESIEAAAPPSAGPATPPPNSSAVSVAAPAAPATRTPVAVAAPAARVAPAAVASARISAKSAPVKVASVAKPASPPPTVARSKAKSAVATVTATPPPVEKQAGPLGPRQQCGARTGFSLYRCMQQQCDFAKWQRHPQCLWLKATDKVE